MTNQLNRRNFIKRSSVVGIAGCTLLLSAKLNSLNAFDNLSSINEPIDPTKLNYCGYTCPVDCKFLKEQDYKVTPEAYEQPTVNGCDARPQGVSTSFHIVVFDFFVQ